MTLLFHIYAQIPLMTKTVENLHGCYRKSECKSIHLLIKIQNMHENFPVRFMFERLCSVLYTISVHKINSNLTSLNKSHYFFSFCNYVSFLPDCQVGYYHHQGHHCHPTMQKKSHYDHPFLL